MAVLRSYVVRVYRDELDGITGIVESVETGDITSFQSSDELWAGLVQVPSHLQVPVLGIRDQKNDK